MINLPPTDDYVCARNIFSGAWVVNNFSFRMPPTLAIFMDVHRNNACIVMESVKPKKTLNLTEVCRRPSLTSANHKAPLIICSTLIVRFEKVLKCGLRPGILFNA